MSKLKQFLYVRWSSISDRERLLVAGGGFVLIVLIFFSLVWLPVRERYRELREITEKRINTIRWMEQASYDAARFKVSTGSRLSVQKGDSLLSLADRSVRKQGLGSVLKRVEPEGQDKVRLWFEQAPFQSLLTWMEGLHDQYGIEAVNVAIEKGKIPGLVDAQLVLVMTAVP
ncbi:MAG: type II secretion system protein M [Magnetococcales bacterium]|nr:type II secretion system protein M [Magnetococcales bacterium]MBF0321765.1 type II secretion system protein M [Magnetococcales bacterium]